MEVVKILKSDIVIVKKIFIVLSLFIIFTGILRIIYSERDTFTQKYDDTYWKDRFEHSQWALPLSKRIIGDDGLYAYIGYRLTRGDSLDGYNAEVPPLGKYFIGLSILIFDNPYYFALFFGIGSLYLFYLIARRALNNTVGACFVVSLLFLDPLFFSQFWKSALDICQLFFLLAHIVLFSNILNLKENNTKKYIFYALAAGISLGLFTQVKYPLLLPIIFIAETLYFFLKKMGKEYLVYLIGVCFAILIVNVKFFLDGNSPFDFLNLQKYILSFYLKSQLIAHKESIWQTLFLGRFPEISNRNLIPVSEWWIMWPVAAILALPASFISIFKNRTTLLWQGFGILLLGSFAIYTLTPSYPRYLIIVLPLIYLFFAKVVSNRISLNLKYVFMIAVLFYGLINANTFIKDDPGIILNNFYYNFSHQYFQDVYQENLAEKSKSLISREKFRLIAQKTMEGAAIKNIDIMEISRHIKKDKGNIKLKITYYTQDLGSFSELKNLKLEKGENKWKISWSWDMVLNGFLPDYSVQTERIIGKRGAVTDSDGRILVQDSEGYLISVNPEKIDLKREQTMLKFISVLGDVEAPYLQNAYLENSLPDSYVPLVTLFYSLETKTKSKLLSFPGLKISPYESRIYEGINQLGIKNTFYTECCTRIYSSYSYHGVDGLEKTYDAELSGYDGGEIVIKDKNGKVIRTILKKEAKNGQDITASL